MSDSVSVVIGGEAAAGLTDLPVVPDAGREGEHALADPHPDTGEGATAMALERELALEGVDDRLDPLAQPSERAEAGLLVAPVGAHEPTAERGDELLELRAREALVADHGLAAGEGALEQRRRHLALGLVGGGQAEAARHPVRRAEE